MRSKPVVSATLLYCATSAVSVPGQVDWREIAQLDRVGGVTAYDANRDRLVLHRVATNTSSTETWEFNGSAWHRLSPNNTPTARLGSAMVYDAARGRTVLFGGLPLFGGGGGTDTWEWDGTDWSLRTPVTAPPARSAPAMAFDASRGRVVLFGGSTSVMKSVTHFNDTWEWDGTNWRRVLGTSPPARTGHSLAFDSGRNRVVLFGGTTQTSTSGGPLDDTWEFDGSTWTQAAPTNRPNARSLHAMTYDRVRARTLLFGGVIGGSATADAWEWNGSNWVGPLATPVPARSGAALTFDTQRNRVLLFGGSSNNGGEVYVDLWQSVGGIFTRLLDSSTPPPRHSAAAAFDARRGRLMVFGGVGLNLLGDHWEFDGTRWLQQSGSRPQARGRAAMVYDSRHDRTLLFGGEIPGAAADTWEWDGASWRNIVPTAVPPARFDHAMVFDAARGQTVLFGGLDLRGALGDTWVFDGTTWTQRAPLRSPTARSAHAMAFDAGRAEVVLFGGGSPLPITNDTWVWDGSNWSQRNPTAAPPPSNDHAMAFDAQRGRVVLFGGGFYSNDTWEWDGANWQQRAPVVRPAGRTRHNLLYDPLAARCVSFGGSTAVGVRADLWSYGAIEPATATSYGNGCAGSVGVPGLTAPSPAWLGDLLVLRVGPTPVNAQVLFWIGDSATLWQGFALPLDLTVAGMPGCSVHASIVLTFAAAALGNTASTSITVPASGALLGTDVYAQTLVGDANANATGAVVSNALRLRLGSR